MSSRGSKTSLVPQPTFIVVQQDRARGHRSELGGHDTSGIDMDIHARDRNREVPQSAPDPTVGLRQRSLEINIGPYITSAPRQQPFEFAETRSCARTLGVYEHHEQEWLVRLTPRDVDLARSRRTGTRPIRMRNQQRRSGGHTHPPDARGHSDQVSET